MQMELTRAEALLRSALILLADHELSVASFTARRADPGGCIDGAMGEVTGRIPAGEGGEPSHADAGIFPTPAAVNPRLPRRSGASSFGVLDRVSVASLTGAMARP
jgi:hypothetical protein